MSNAQRFYRNGRWVTAEEARSLLEKRREENELKKLGVIEKDGELVNEVEVKKEEEKLDLEKELNLMADGELKDLAVKVGVKHTWVKNRKTLIKDLLKIKKSTDNK